MEAHELTTDFKIAEAMERISRVLRVLLWDRAKRIGMSPLQTQILLYVHENPGSGGGVSRLASEFGLTQATISDAVSTLISKGYLERRPSPEDRRLKLLKTTPRGRRLAERASDWMAYFHGKVHEFSEEDKRESLAFMYQLIHKFQENGLNAEMHLCPGCRNYTVQPGANQRDRYVCAGSGDTRQLTDVKFYCPHWQAPSGGPREPVH